MAVLSCTYFSNSLSKQEHFNVVVPQGCEKNAKVLYLLHGLSDNDDIWLYRTSIVRYAEKYGIAVVMPDGARSFYTDMLCGGKYYTYVAHELVDYTRELFSFSSKREDTFIAGNSMGGYGAVKIALRRNEVFGTAATLSGVLDIEGRYKSGLWDDDMEFIVGTDYDFSQSPENPLWLIKNIEGEKPRIYQACGTEDFLYQDNQTFKNAISRLDFDYKYEEAPGIHDWDFWDRYIQKAIEFMLEK